jgi:hypothetical protein
MPRSQEALADLLLAARVPFLEIGSKLGSNDTTSFGSKMGLSCARSTKV